MGSVFARASGVHGEPAEGDTIVPADGSRPRVQEKGGKRTRRGPSDNRTERVRGRNVRGATQQM